MYFTPGWGAILTSAGAIAGVAVGAGAARWNMHSILTKQTAHQHKIEQREAVAVITDAIVALADNGQFFHSARMLAKSVEPDGKLDAECLDRFNAEVPRANERVNAVKAALRRSMLVIDLDELESQIAPLNELIGHYSDALAAARNSYQDEKAFGRQTDAAENVRADMTSRVQSLMDSAATLLKTR